MWLLDRTAFGVLPLTGVPVAWQSPFKAQVIASIARRRAPSVIFLFLPRQLRLRSLPLR